nr:ribonuclease H-like domain-containing protein [Tanacetum cinerariifolium]
MEKSLDYNNSFLGEYECSSLALEREERRDEKKRLNHLKQDQTIYKVNKYIHGFTTDLVPSTPTSLTPKELKVDKIVLSWIFTKLSDTLQESEDVVTFALDGLPDKYDQVCGIMHHKDTFPDLKTTRSMLFTEEMRLKSKSLSLPVDFSSSSPLVLMAELGTNRRPSSPQVKSWWPCYNFSKVASRFDGTLSRYKARLMANDSTQFEGVDVDETFSPVVKLDLDSLNYFLGISVMRDSTGLFLSQRNDSVSDPALYRSLAGSLQYLTFTCLDISYAVQQLFSSSTTDLVAYSNANWAGCPATRRSTSSYCVFLVNNLLSWSSKRQPAISRSSAVAEYRGVANAIAETCWLRNLLRELHTPLSSATLVYCDNVSVVYLSSNPLQHQRTEHIEIDIHFLQDLVAAGHVRVLHVPSRYQYADIFTTSLPSALFEEFHISLSVRCPSAPTAKEC